MGLACLLVFGPEQFFASALKCGTDFASYRVLGIFGIFCFGIFWHLSAQNVLRLIFGEKSFQPYAHNRQTLNRKTHGQRNVKCPSMGIITEQQFLDEAHKSFDNGIAYHLHSASPKLHSRRGSRPKRINSRPNLMKRLADTDVWGTSNTWLRAAASSAGCCCCCSFTDCLPKRMNRFESARCRISASSSAQMVITHSR